MHQLIHTLANLSIIVFCIVATVIMIGMTRN